MKKKVRPQDRWNEKVGLISKSYKLKKQTTEEFKKACDKRNVSQASQITLFMEQFINETKEWG